MKKESLSIWNIHKIDFKNPNPVLYTITHNLVEYNFIVNYRNHSSKIFLIQYQDQEEYAKASVNPDYPLRKILGNGDFTIIHYFNPVIYNDRTEMANHSLALPTRCLQTLKNIINIIITGTDNTFSVKYCYEKNVHISATDIELPDGVRALTDDTSGVKETVNYTKIYGECLNTFYANYDPDKVLKINNYFRSDKDIVAYADKIMNGKMAVFGILGEYPYDSLENFDWNVRFGNNPNSYQNYLQSLTPCYAMVRAYDLTKSNHYLKYALDLFNSWYGYACKPESVIRNSYMWKDHPAALRSEILFRLLHALKGHECFNTGDAYKIIDILYATIYWLSDSNNYSFKHNHGIMQDRALIELGYFFNQPEFIKKAILRLIEQKNNAFNSECIHTENSAQYAFMVIEMFGNIASFLKIIKDKQAEVLTNEISKMDEYLSWLIMPDGHLIQTGDSPYLIPRYKPKKTDDFHKIYPKSGIYFYRNKTDKNPVDRTYKFFKCGCSSKVHKHFDDLSFILYSKGKEIFVDSGFPGYEDDDCRRYYISSKAHNTLLVDNEGYYYDKKLPQNLNFRDYYLGDDFDYIHAESKAYKGVTISRRFISADDFTFIKDNLSSFMPHTYSQIFHLSERVELVEYDDYGFVVKINDDYLVKLVQFNKNTKINVYSTEGIDEGASPGVPETRTDKEKKNGKTLLFGYGYRALSIGKFKNICTVKFDISGSRKAEFKTGIFIVSKDNKIRIFDKEIDFDLSSVKFHNDHLVVGDSVFSFVRNTDISFWKKKLHFLQIF